MAKQLASSNLSTLPDTYLYSLAQAHSTFAAIGSDDSLRLFDSPTLKLTQNIQPVHTGVACLKPSPDRGRGFVTAGRDGRIRLWDSRDGKATAGTEFREPKGAGFSAIACSENFIAAGTESTKEGLGDVNVLVYDVRNPGAVLRTYAESHTDSVTQLAWHPVQKNVLLSGSTDGLVSLFDANQSDEDDALQQVLNPRSAVHCSGFLADDQVYVVSTDEHFSVYGLDKTGAVDDEALPVMQYGDVREKLSCMYVIDVVQHPSLPSPVMAYGHNERQTLCLVSLQAPDWNFGPVVELPGAHGEEVVRDVLFVDAQTTLTCGEDGHVRAWNFGGEGAGAAAGEVDVDAGGRKARKLAKKQRKESERFAPY